ncbi:hypothetical protein [Bacilliculturomica massiliensis]|uniref:hypothetical protein n=1 Tax=Bacilliculturomica massiliensis TaxID=1917867 RepID=UPI0010314482|nr:hypothetical protein [Bacilliculturomica massiliensis]
MKKLAGFEKAAPYADQAPLPVGGYILKILDARETENSWGGSSLVISFDIEEGDYKGFFSKNYKAQTQEDKKWKGTARWNVPNDDGSEKDAKAMRAFKTMITAIEDSNEGYHWDWDEIKLKGKIVGGVFGRKEYDFDGRHGFYTTCRNFKAVHAIREGSFKVPADWLLNREQGTSIPSEIPEGFEPLSDEDMPF